MVCGAGSTADGGRSTVIGFEAHGDGISDVAIGSFARTAFNGPPNRENVAIGGVIELGGGVGAPTIADGGGSVAVGAGAVARGERAVALGRQASALGEGSVVLGAGSSDGGRSNVVSFGNGALNRSLINVEDITNTGTTTSRALVVNQNATIGNGLIVSNGGASIVGGINANAAKVTGVADGAISASSTDAVNGRQLNATNQNVTAAQAAADAAQATADTAQAAADAAQATADAAQAAANAAQGTADAAQADALAALANLQAVINQLIESGVCGLNGGTVNCGNNLELAGGTAGPGATNAIAVGTGANAQSSGGIAVGENATAVLSNSVAIGAGATALSSVAVGTGAQATGTNSTAVGDNAVASGHYAAAYGNEAQATHDNSVAIGNGSTTAGPNTVSVGSSGNERRITHVAPGVAGTDAVNMDQLHAAMAGMGTASLAAANAYTDEQVAKMREHAASGIAATAAMMNIRPSAVGKTAIGVGVGHYDGLTAVGFSLARAARENILLSLGAAATVGGQPVVRGGITMEF